MAVASIARRSCARLQFAAWERCRKARRSIKTPWYRHCDLRLSTAINWFAQTVSLLLGRSRSCRVDLKASSLTIDQLPVLRMCLAANQKGSDGANNIILTEPFIRP